MYPKRAILSIPRYHPRTDEEIEASIIFRQYSESEVIKRHARLEIGQQTPDELKDYFEKCGHILKSLVIQLHHVNRKSSEIFQYLTNIENLEIYTNWTRSSEEDFMTLKDAFQHLSSLRHLRLTTSNKITRLNKFQLLEAIREGCPSLKSLVFEVNEIIPPEVEPILNSDRYKFEFPHLEELHLKFMYELNEREIDCLAENCPKIKELQIINSNLNDECIKIIAEKLDHLKALNLANVKDITNESLQHIANHHKGLTVSLKCIQKFTIF